MLYQLDMGFFTVILSKCNAKPVEIHFQVAAQVLKYLVDIKEKGIIYC